MTIFSVPNLFTLLPSPDATDRKKDRPLCLGTSVVIGAVLPDDDRRREAVENRTDLRTIPQRR